MSGPIHGRRPDPVVSSRRAAPSPLAVAMLLAAGMALALAMLLAAPAVHPWAAGMRALAADPSPAGSAPRAFLALASGDPASPSAAASTDPSPAPGTPSSTPAVAGDPRSSGEGAGLVGAPLFALGGMLLVGLLAAAGTLLYVRLTGGPRPG